MIELTPSKEGVLLNVHAQPGARRNGLLGERAGALRVAVTAAPDKGKANAAILDVLADALGLRPSAIALVSGETSRHKRILLAGLTPEEAGRRIAGALPEPKPSDTNS
ncbi:DUF167 domain-containing protein [Planctomyces sp. SH-PL62]|uniref:DUF167 domain-containing protein n=1 Tax=Planctomyces sp. SH-PL62 TaxID=1636152 RepID=UPI00078E87A1|nr:DUF167 domain-containing protein [Planctomyces sp. SH-PL62]AMV39901.1 hypothetical protein VT85_20885 [Planctomyces sp. SH-PL62]